VEDPPKITEAVQFFGFLPESAQLPGTTTLSKTNPSETSAAAAILDL
jgi:hypothetical protein